MSITIEDSPETEQWKLFNGDDHVGTVSYSVGDLSLIHIVKEMEDRYESDVLNMFHNSKVILNSPLTYIETELPYIVVEG